MTGFFTQFDGILIYMFVHKVDCGTSPFIDGAFAAMLAELSKYARRLRVVVPVFRTLDALLVQGYAPSNTVGRTCVCDFPHFSFSLDDTLKFNFH